MRPPLSLKGRAIALLAQREQSTVELRRKLLRHAQSAAKAARAARADPTDGRGTASATGGRAVDAASRADDDTQAGSAAHDDTQAGSAAQDDTQAGSAAQDATRAGSAAHDDMAGPADLHAQVDAVIDWLGAHDYLNEDRFIESRVHARSGRFGQARIRRELAQHGLALPADIAAGLRASELERATDVWQRKFGGAPVDMAAQAKQTRFLVARGFSADVVRQLVRLARGHHREAAPDDDHDDPAHANDSANHDANRCTDPGADE